MHVSLLNNILCLFCYLFVLNPPNIFTMDFCDFLNDGWCITSLFTQKYTHSHTHILNLTSHFVDDILSNSWCVV